MISIPTRGLMDVHEGKTGGVRARHELIKAHRHKHRVQAMCRLLGVARAATTRGSRSRWQLTRKRMPDCCALNRASFTACQGLYGAPRVFLDLRETGEECSKHGVIRLMREH